MSETKDKKKNKLFIDYSPEEQEEIRKSFLKFFVRKEIANQNKKLKEIFSRYGESYAEGVTFGFSNFNSAFVDLDFVKTLNDYESMDESKYFSLSENERKIYDFNVGISQICMYKTPGVSIPNCVSLPLMVAYANMQNKVLLNVGKFSDNILDVIYNAGIEIRGDYLKKYKKTLNDSSVRKASEAHKTDTKSNCKKWVAYLEFLKFEISNGESRQSIDYLFENVFLTDKNQLRILESLERASQEAVRNIEQKRDHMKKSSLSNYEDEDKVDLEFNDFANIADYDEVFSEDYYEDMVNSARNDVLIQFVNEVEEPLKEKAQIEKI